MRYPPAVLAALPFACAGLPPALAAQALALRPPMGRNDRAHYQCHDAAQTIPANARALVRTGLPARGFGKVTIDDCGMRPKGGRHKERSPPIRSASPSACGP